MNWPLYRSLHARKLTQVKLARLTGVDRSVLARILTNEPGRGKETRGKLAPHLTAEEWGMLGWPFWEWQLNGGTLTTTEAMEQISMGNIVPSNDD